MGYTTDFEGRLSLSRRLTPVEKDYINYFAETRRMGRDVNKLMELYKGEGGIPNPKDNTPESIYGPDGGYYVGGGGTFGQDHDASVIDYNTPPGQLEHSGLANFKSVWDENKKRISEDDCQPSLWCQWIIEEHGDEHFLAWDGNEKFYYYVEWMQYLINHFFEPWGVKLKGSITWVGEDSSDRGKIKVTDNKVEVFEGTTTYKKVK